MDEKLAQVFVAALGDANQSGFATGRDLAQREYAYGPAGGFPDTKVGTFDQVLMDETSAKGWTVISMKNDWKRIFAFE